MEKNEKLLKKSIKNFIVEDLKNYPFHNFWLILNMKPNPNLGGTCSDKVLILKKKLYKKMGIKTKLHSAIINKKNLHRMLKIKINNKIYFIDNGLGWPITELIPSYREIEISNYGITFKTEINRNTISLIRVKKNKKILNYTTTLSDIPENKVFKEIKNRFLDKSIYPFNNSVRYSQIINNEFYFLKGDFLKYSKNNKLYTKKINSMDEYLSLFKNLFKFDLKIALEAAKKTEIFKNSWEIYE